MRNKERLTISIRSLRNYKLLNKHFEIIKSEAG